MPQWRVRDVMTTQVITVRDDAPYAEIAAGLTGERISAVPVVDRFDVVVGVVSGTDLQGKFRVGDLDARKRVGRWRWWAAPLLRWPAGTAAQVMTAPALTIEPHRSLPAAARIMFRRNVGRLLVVDDTGRLRRIVSRSDLFKVHGRLDAVIRDEVMERVLRRTLMIEPMTAQATVDGGVVTLTGRTQCRTTAHAAVLLTEAVAGVTEVVDRLGFDLDDLDDTAVADAASEPVDGEPVSARRTAENRESSPSTQRAPTIAGLR